jgi:hypothetical protein
MVRGYLCFKGNVAFIGLWNKPRDPGVRLSFRARKTGFGRRFEISLSI